LNFFGNLKITFVEHAKNYLRAANFTSANGKRRFAKLGYQRTTCLGNIRTVLLQIQKQN